MLLIGAGALGSAVGEMLVRGGVRHLTVCDDDLVVAGNLVRHTLALPDVGGFKAKALAERLNAISPNAEVRDITHAFPPDDEPSRAILRTADTVIDCTGETLWRTLYRRTRGTVTSCSSRFRSVSSRRLGFSFVAYGESFPVEMLLSTLRPWLDRQAEAFRDSAWPREGVGCWHPVFPAGVIELWLLSAAAVQHLVEVVDRKSDKPELAVFERVDTNGIFSRAFAGLLAPPVSELELWSTHRRFGLHVGAGPLNYLLDECARACSRETGASSLGCTAVPTIVP